MQHSNLGASGMHRWMKCPGSVALCEKLPVVPRSSIYAATGTLAHQLIDEALNTGGFAEGTRIDPFYYVDHVFKVDGHDVVPDTALIEGVQTMIDYVCEATVQQHYTYVCTELRVNVDPWVERQGVTPPVPMFATTDVAMANNAGLLEIVDYKSGTGIVVAIKDNPQLMYYAAGTLLHMKQTLPSLDVQQVKITIVQPNAGDMPVRSQTLDVIDVFMWVDDVLVPAVQAVTQPDPPLHPGDWCRFCPGARACPALIAAANELAKREFGGHMLPDEPTILAKQLDLAEKAVMWADALRAYALEQLQQQVRIPGWGLEPTRPVRKWRDEAEVIPVLSSAHLPLETTHKLELRSPAQLEKNLKRLVPPGWWDRQLAPLIEAKSSGVKLARVTNNDPVTEFTEGDA